MADKAQMASTMNTRQKVTAGVIALVALIIIWQVWGMISGPKKKTTTTRTRTSSTQTAGTTGMSVTTVGPQPTEAAAPPPPLALTPEDQAMAKAQQEAQQRYQVAINELQMLRIAENIAKTNKSIMAAKFDTVNSEKKIVTLLSQPTMTGPAFAPSVTTPMAAAPAPEQPAIPTANYTVVSVSQVRDVWSAVLGNQGVLYNVKVGDVLPVDGSTVISINRNGVVLQKDGQQRKVSLVSII